MFAVVLFIVSFSHLAQRMFYDAPGKGEGTKIKRQRKMISKKECV